MNKMVPELRFPGFEREWEQKPLSRLLKRKSTIVEVDPDVEYREIGVRSHGKGVFHKELVLGRELGNKRVFHVIPNALVVNIVFAWEQAIALTTESENGFIASHRFPMFTENGTQSYLPFILHLLLTQRGNALLELASPGGAGRNKTLGQDAFMRLNARVPTRDEQRQIADFIDTVSRKTTLLSGKKRALEDYRRGLTQQLFSRELRFTRDDGTAFPDWEKLTIGDVLKPSRLPGSWGDTARKLSVQLWARGVRETNRAGSAATQYYTRRAGQFIYSKLDFLNCAFGIIPTYLDGLESTADLPAFDISPRVDEDFLLYYVIRRDFYERYGATADGTRKARRIQEDVFASFPFELPHLDEQRKISAVLSTLDAKIDALTLAIAEMETFKKGLLQKLFV